MWCLLTTIFWISGDTWGRISLHSVFRKAFAPTALFCFHSNSNLADSHFGIVQMVTQHASMKSRTFPVEVTAAPGLGCKRRSTVQLNPQTLQVRTTSLWTHRNWLLEQRSLSANTDNSCIRSGNRQLLSD